MKYAKLLLTVEDADTLIGLLDGCLGTSADECFNKFAIRTINKLDKQVLKIQGRKSAFTKITSVVPY